MSVSHGISKILRFFAQTVQGVVAPTHPASSAENTPLQGPNTIEGAQSDVPWGLIHAMLPFVRTSRPGKRPVDYLKLLCIIQAMSHNVTKWWFIHSRELQLI